jgi:two-component system phosphate regulon sensor histidine kinase PhoR
MNEFLASSCIQALPLPTLVIGADRAIALANSAAQDLLGDQILGRHYVAALRQPSLTAAIEDSLRVREDRIGQFTTTDGRTDWQYDVHIIPTDGRLVLSFVDTTNAQELDALRRDFVANVSHELRTPLAAVLGFIETLRGPAKDDDAARERFLGIMEREANRMSRLVDDLLSLSRVEEAARRRPTDVVSLSELVPLAISELQPVIDGAHGAVSIEDQSGGCAVLGDPGQLRQVIGNLVGNALRYGAPTGDVLIKISTPAYETRLRQNGVRLSVQDYGPGIAAHHLPRLAERFYRVDSHRAQQDGGTGLGLAIVKHIAHRHRGHLLIESEVGKGSTFTVILPVLK